MALETQKTDERSLCKLNGALNIWEAADIWRQLRGLLLSPEPLTLDLTQVEACDGAGIQIICQIQHAIRQRGKRVEISGLSEPVQAAMAQAGIDTQGFLKPEGEDHHG